MNKLIVDFLEYFFGFSPTREFGLQWIIWVLIAASMITAFYLVFLSRKQNEKTMKKIIQDYPGRFVTLSVLLLINVFSRLNRVEVLSMRFITYLLLAWLAFTFFRLYRDLAIVYPQKQEHKKAPVQSMEKKYHIHRNKRPKTRTR